MSAVFEALTAATRDEAWERSVLDRVFEAYRASERLRTAFEEFDRFHRINRLSLPSLLKLFLGTVAIAHRRRGTWA